MHTNEYYINGQGAKVYYDIRKHTLLSIPMTGVVHNVLSVGFFGHLSQPMICISNEGESQIYLLPEDLMGWVIYCLSMEQQLGPIFPKKVMFGYLFDGGKMVLDMAYL